MRHLRQRKVWTEAKILRLRELRDVQGLKWRVIAEVLGMNLAQCHSAYHYHNTGAEQLDETQPKRRARKARPPRAIQQAIGVDREPGANRYRAAQTTPADHAIPASQAPSHRARRISLTDADVLARVAELGITAGVFGDPPPGRSALDKRGQLP